MIPFWPTFNPSLHGELLPLKPKQKNKKTALPRVFSSKIKNSKKVKKQSYDSRSKNVSVSNFLPTLFAPGFVF